MYSNAQADRLWTISKYTPATLHRRAISGGRLLWQGNVSGTLITLSALCHEQSVSMLFEDYSQTAEIYNKSQCHMG